MLCFLGKGENQRKSARICENLRLGSVCPLRFVPLSAPTTTRSSKQKTPKALAGWPRSRTGTGKRGGCTRVKWVPFLLWKRLKGKTQRVETSGKLLRRKQSSAKISKISRNTLKSNKSDIFYLLRNLLKYLSSANIFASAKFSEVFTLCIFTLWLFPSPFGVFPVLCRFRIGHFPFET